MDDTSKLVTIHPFGMSVTDDLSDAGDEDLRVFEFIEDVFEPPH